MREIKFRGLFTYHGGLESKWLYGYPFIEYKEESEDNEKIEIHSIIEYDQHYYCRTTTTGIQVKTGTLSQYTGLKDENGKEIYEGDIVNYTDGKLVKRKGKIEFECYGFMLNEINGIQIGFLGEIDDIEEFEFEVVGNIYENVELLEG